MTTEVKDTFNLNVNLLSLMTVMISMIMTIGDYAGDTILVFGFISSVTVYYSVLYLQFTPFTPTVLQA